MMMHRTLALTHIAALAISCSEKQRRVDTKTPPKKEMALASPRVASNSGERQLRNVIQDFTRSERIPINSNHSGSDPSKSKDDCSKIIDTCPVPSGITWQCKKRFIAGVNYAWHDFAIDFGGMSHEGKKGISGNPGIASEIAEIKASGANVIRWWIMPDFRGDGVSFDANGYPLGLGGTFYDDLNTALELAERNDIYLMLTIFSFDGFRPQTGIGGNPLPSLQPIVVNSNSRQLFLDRVIAPMAAAVESNVNKRRAIAWDLINEPEWAISGPSLYGDPSFDPIAGLTTVSHEQMETFLVETIKVLKAHSNALITLGAASIKWKNSWSKLDLDVYQFHIYDWMTPWWPYNKSPAEFGLSDKPVIMGEFPINGLKDASTTQMLSSWYINGYAGGLGWAVTDPNFGWQSHKGELSGFAKNRACELSI